MEIKLAVKTAWGNLRFYPVCDKAKLLCELKKTKTFTPRDVDLLGKIGFTVSVEIKQPTCL